MNGLMVGLDRPQLLKSQVSLNASSCPGRRQAAWPEPVGLENYGLNSLEVCSAPKAVRDTRLGQDELLTSQRRSGLKASKYSSHHHKQAFT